MKNINLATYVNESSFYSASYITYNHYYLFEEVYLSIYNENIRCFIVQIPSNKKINRLSIDLEIRGKNYHTDIDIKSGIENYFYLQNISNEFFISANRIFTYFLNFFFNDKIEGEKGKILGESLLKGCISRISTKDIELQSKNIIRFFKLCLKLKIDPKNIDYIEAKIEEKKFRRPLADDMFLSSDEIDLLTIKKEKEKPKLLKLIVKIYAHYNRKFLTQLIQSKNGKDCSRTLLDLLTSKELKLDELSFDSEEELNTLQENLLHITKSKEEINYVIKISQGLTNILKFMAKNNKEINDLMEKYAGYFQYRKNNFLSLDEPKINDNIEELFSLLSNIIALTKDRKYVIINYEEIFENLVNLYKNESLNELCKLDKLANLFKTQNINYRYLENFYSAIHNKGIILIKEGKMNVEDIVNFMTAQDIYYYNPTYKTHENKDPIIFNYIPITDEDKDYLKNIDLIKKYRLYEIFWDSTQKMKENFYTIILNQIKNIRGFNSIFEIFPIKSIDKPFNFLINGKLRELIGTVLDEKEENYDFIFQILDNILICNHHNDLDLKYIVETVQINYQFPSKYYFYLFKNEKIGFIVSKIKDLIINFFFEQIKVGKANAESLISLLLLSKNNNLTLYLLNQMDNMIVKEEDIYQREETQNFLLFKLFLEKCKELINNKEVSEGKYLNQSFLIKSKVEDDLKNSRIKYDVCANLIDENNSFYERILVIFDRNEDDAKKIYEKIKENLNICKNKFDKFEQIEDFYNTFYNNSKRDVINMIKNKLKIYKQKTIEEIAKLDEGNFINNKEFNYPEVFEASKNIKFKNSSFFMSIYRKKYENEITEKTEDDIFKESLDNFKDTIKRIILQKESKEPFFGINNIKEILEVVQNPNNNLEAEINFVEKEFESLGKKDYIKKELINDLINFSTKDKLIKLLNGIIYFIDSFNLIRPIQITDFINNLKASFEIVKSDGVNGEEIKKAIDLLLKYDYDIKKETSLIKFYELLLGKQEAILFIKKLKDSNLEIRNLNEFIDETENSQLQTTDIDNLLDVFTFFKNLMENEKIKTDEDLLLNFRKLFDSDDKIVIKLQGYLNTYGEIIQLYQTYDENPEMTIQKIDKLLKDSTVDIYKDIKSDIFIYKIKYKNQNGENVETGIKELEELRNKIMMSSTNTNAINDDNNNDIEGRNNRRSKKSLTNEFINIIDNIMQLTNTLNVLQKSGYPNVINLSLKINNSKVFEENDEDEDNIIRKDLQEIIEYYNETNTKFKKSIKKGYENCPFLRLFYGKQLIKLHENATRKGTDISHLMNSVSMNKVKNYNVDYLYNYETDSIQNINNFLVKLFKKNGVNLDDIYNYNKVKEETGLSPGLYRKIKSGDNSDLINNILNIYLNLTGNAPIINTLLICNEETNLEQIKAFLYRAVFCNKPALFLITNMECLELKVTTSIIKTLKMLYKAKNYSINSYILFFYEKVDSGLVRDIEKIIPEKNILDNSFLEPPKEKFEEFQKVELYSSKYSGYGKTTEIIYKVKNLKGEYHYLPIGGSFSRNYVLNNLKNLKLDLKKGSTTYLHLDLSETDNDDLMNEILFKLIILRYLDSKDEIFYLGNEIHIIIEIPKGFIEFDKKYKILNLFKKIYIDELKPLRLEENIKLIKDSPISIVAEVLSLYDNKQIATKNIDLDSPIRKSAKECENIINKHFTVENQSYYQKMNFIKILSIQFKKFSKSSYFNYEYANENGLGEMMKKSRTAVIKNFIELTKLFTRSPFDTVLLKQKKSMDLFGKYDENQAIEEGVKALANEKQEIFSFEQIKPSLVFFNQDGESFSIISNNDRNDPEYKNLKALWNSQNPNQNNWNELVDYKNMKHENFLEQIKNLFALDKMSIEELKQLCINLGNYIFVSDNFIKMVRILLNIEAKIPVILMGETGVGKTKLLEMLTTLYNKGVSRMKRLQIHAGTTDQKIVEFIEQVNQEVKEEEKENELTWIFFDEINTCNSLGLITEIMCNHTYLGKKINDNFIFLGACNPYRILTKKMRESGLVYYNMKETGNKLNNLVYTVNPLPHALLNFVFDFASLQPKDEKKYITNTVISIIDKIEKEGKISNINQNDKNKLINEIIESISICHDFIRKKYDRSSVSMREIRRFGIFFEYFLNYFKKRYESTYRRMKSSLNLTLYLCYYLRLNDKEYRKELSEELGKFYTNSSFINAPENEIKIITKEMSIEKGKGIALNRALRENLFTCFVCIDNNVPLIIIGKPGTGKSLSFQILYNTLKGEYSDSPMFKEKGKLYRYYYQGSETSTAEGIEQVFAKAVKSQLKNKGKQIISLVFFDEMGLAERSSNNPLKVIHYLLERDSKNSVPFLGISNWRLDAAKINRALSLTITDYDIEDLEETAIAIAEALDVELANKYKEFFQILARTYNEYIIFNQNSIKENKDFHGNRDFYTLIKTAMRELIGKRNDLPINERRILTETAILCLNRNFGGLENSSNKIKEIFKKEYGYKYDEEVELNGNFSVLDAIKKNILDPNSRYLMLISEGNDGSEIVKYLLDSIGKKYIELVGSKYRKDLKTGRYSEEILNKIKYIMETDNVLILRDLDMIYPSLYDLFNQNFTVMGEKRFARIAFEYAKISSEVNKDFHCIVIVNNNQIKDLKLDPPFLNRFEKHIVNFRMLLEEKDVEIAKNISEYIELIASFNHEEKLKIDLEKLLINGKQHNIEGLIFKIKNDLLKNKEEDYENVLTKEVFKKLVPTFCQDIMASMIYFKNKLDQNYKEFNEIVKDIYKESNYHNFEAFFKNLKSKKNIVYTFSKVTENLFDNANEDVIENKFGSFNKQEDIIENNIQSIKEEKELITTLRSFVEKDNQKIMVIKFSESDLNKINSTNYIIENFQKDNPKLDEKIIIFIIHKQRQSKGAKVKRVIPDLISFINDEFYQIFIDNLQGKQNSDVFRLMQKKNEEELAKEYIENSNFIDNKIFTILNYMKYTLFFETNTINLKNYTTKITEELIKNEKIKSLIKKNLKAQGKNIKGIIKDAFTTELTEVNDVDFFEVINSKLSNYFCLYLLRIIYHGLKENVLNQIIITKHLDMLMQIDFFNNMINSTFEKVKFNFNPPIKMNVNANKITIYNGLEIPKSKFFLDKLIQYVIEEICKRYFDNEGILRKNYTKEDKIADAIKNYNTEQDRLEENVKTEINKYEFFKVIYSQNSEELKKLLLEEYLKYYVIKYIEKRNVDYKTNEKILSFLKLILKVKLDDKHSPNFEFENSLEEFIKIIIFTQGYREDIKNLFDTFIDVQKYCENIEEYMIKIMNEERIKYEISERNKKYTKIVNINFFNIIESLLRGMFLFSIELMKKDKVQGLEFLHTFASIEANLQKLNKKFYLYSKEIFNIRAIIKIEEGY